MPQKLPPSHTHVKPHRQALQVASPALQAHLVHQLLQPRDHSLLQLPQLSLGLPPACASGGLGPPHCRLPNTLQRCRRCRLLLLLLLSCRHR